MSFLWRFEKPVKVERVDKSKSRTKYEGNKEDTHVIGHPKARSPSLVYPLQQGQQYELVDTHGDNLYATFIGVEEIHLHFLYRFELHDRVRTPCKLLPTDISKYRWMKDYNPHAIISHMPPQNADDYDWVANGRPCPAILLGHNHHVTDAFYLEPNQSGGRTRRSAGKRITRKKKAT